MAFAKAGQSRAQQGCCRDTGKCSLYTSHRIHGRTDTPPPLCGEEEAAWPASAWPCPPPGLQALCHFVDVPSRNRGPSHPGIALKVSALAGPALCSGTPPGPGTISSRTNFPATLFLLPLIERFWADRGEDLRRSSSRPQSRAGRRQRSPGCGHVLWHGVGGRQTYAFICHLLQYKC